MPTKDRVMFKSFSAWYQGLDSEPSSYGESRSAFEAGYQAAAALVRNEALEEAVQAVLKRMESNGMGDWKEAKMLRKALSGGKE